MAASEKRQFRMHPDLLYSVIKNQAGTISKAVLELVMNSIDAGATRVDIVLDRKKLNVTDDGKGFGSQQEIDEFFETFGTPHVEGDGAVYGRFRMGRGQIMAFCRNVWRSGEFQMSVDIKEKGLDYTLDKGLAPVVGCVIDGAMYDPLSMSDLLTTGSTLREQCRYTPIPVFFNGERINEDAASAKWTKITDEAYIRIDPSGKQLSIYNLGVLVCHEYASAHGVGGVIVSRKALEVNFARNDVIKGQCSVWKKIKPILAGYADKPPSEKRTRRTDEWRLYMAQQMLSWDGDVKRAGALSDAPIFTDITGRHWNLDQLCNYKVSGISLGPADNLKADLVHQLGRAVVLNEGKMAERFAPYSMVQGLQRLVDQSAGSLNNSLGYFAKLMLANLVSFHELAAGIADDHVPLTEKDLSQSAIVVLRALNAERYVLEYALRRALPEYTFPSRVIYAMRSDTAEAYTDGVKAVYLHQKYLSSAQYGPVNGIDWAAKLVPLLVHEYLHNFNSGTGHTHDAEFYELFHRAMQCSSIAEVNWQLFKSCVREMKKLPKAVVMQMDHIAVAEDWAADAQALLQPHAVAAAPAVPTETVRELKVVKPRISRYERMEAAGQLVLRFTNKRSAAKRATVRASALPVARTRKKSIAGMSSPARARVARHRLIPAPLINS